MKTRLGLLLCVLAVLLSACSITFKSHIQARAMDQSYTVMKMAVDEPNTQPELYFVRALFVNIDNDSASTPVQGVKIKWTYIDGDYVTTIPLDMVKWVPDDSIDVPEFSVDWNRAYMNDPTGGWQNVFQDGAQFNPNRLLGNPKYYSQIVIRLNQADYDLVMSYIFK